MVQLEWVFLLQATIGILMIILLHKMNQLQKKVDGIIKEVQDYVEFVTEDEIEETTFKSFSTSPSQEGERNISRKEAEETKNQLIQSVLGEYFP